MKGGNVLCNGPDTTKLSGSSSYELARRDFVSERREVCNERQPILNQRSHCDIVARDSPCAEDFAEETPTLYAHE